VHKQYDANVLAHSFFKYKIAIKVISYQSIFDNLERIFHYY